MHVFHITNIGTNSINVPSIIADFNRSQSSFRLIYLENQYSTPNSTISTIDFFNCAMDKMRELRTVKYLIGLTALPFDNNYFSEVDPQYQSALISIDQSEVYSPPFKIEDYLKSELLLSILLMLTKINIGHYDTRGCLFDFCQDKKDIVIKLHSGSICADCKARLIYYGISDEDIVSSQKILWNISKDLISQRVNRGCPLGYRACKEFHDIQRNYSDKNIFLAISFNENYQDMIDHLREKISHEGFNLKVVNDNIANKSLLCKICKDIQSCKYGIAEFSGFRHNVSYEFGLMQAYGLHCIGIIKQDKLNEFENSMSDMKGIEIIPYTSVAGDLYAHLKEFIA